MLKRIPEQIIEVKKKFIQAGFEIYLVGGCVRDLLLERKVKDWDFTTNATPEQMLQLFPQAFYNNAFGTVGIPVEGLKEEDHNGVLEITTYRTERDYKDRRHPGVVEWGKTIEEDLSRRDFTINAMALTVSSGEIKLIDPYDGQEDVKKKLIKAVGDPALRFKEDALRLMRAIRFATQLGFAIEEQTLNEIRSDSGLLSEIAKERIKDELMKILASDFPYEGVMLLKNSMLLEHIVPQLLEGIGVSQERPGRHHKDDVFTHNVQSLKFCTSTDPIVRFAALIHDVGKPRVAQNDEEGYVVFHNHEIVGARLAYEIAEDLKFSKKDRNRIITLVRWHMFTVDENITDAAVRRFIRRIGSENVKDMMDLRVGDRLGGGTQTAESWRLKLFKRRVGEELAPPPFSINDLAIDGNDVMKELKLGRGPRVGEILQKLFEEVDEDLSKNNKDHLLKRLREL